MKDFASRMSRSPIPYDLAAAQGIAQDYLGHPVVDLLVATAACSPYLRGLIQSEADWLSDALLGAPETAIDAELARLDQTNLSSLPHDLRRAKRRLAVLIALCDLGGLWSTLQVTGALTRLADRAVQACVSHLIQDEVARGKLPAGADMVVLAMGKMGAHELNYSSDIDLICLFDQDRFDDPQEARTALIRVTRRMASILSDVTDQGYVFRTDLRLRPDAAVTPVCVSMASAERYYEAEGRTWERAAYIKARPCAGDIAAGQRFLQTLTPFVWRKHLDFAAIQDAHDMRLRIRAHRGLNGSLRIEGHNLKLGQGGIREIEFYAQTRQLIAGGRDISLRDPTTLGALSALAAKGWIKPEEAEALSANYLAHRDLEHRLQMVNDAQTHDLPLTSEGIDRIAAFSGQGAAAFRTDLLARLAQTDQITTGFFAPDAAPETPNLTPQQSAIVDSWAQYPALRSARAATIFARLTPLLLNRLQGAANPDEALIALDGFLAGLPAGVQIFSLFEANPQLVDLIVDIAATAPQLAAYLSRHSLVLDGVLGGSFFAPWPDALADQLAQVLRPLSDYEQKLDAARIWQKEWHFRIGVHLLRGLIDGDQAGRQYSDLANAVISALWPVVCAEFARRHGAAPGRGAAVLGMGSLGAGRLSAASDLDVIVIYDALGIEASDGLRALPTRQYFARLTQAFVTAISAQTTKGRLYEVDVRLRPSGRKGPVATSLASFHSYQMDEAWTWEHLALTRARVMAGSADLAADIEALRLQIITLKGQGPKVLADVADMRARLAVTKAGQGAWEAKLGAGRMMDIELFAQALALQAASPARAVPDQIRAGVSVGKLSQSDGQDLVSAYTVMSRLQTALRLVSQVATGPETLGQGGRDFVSRSVQDLDRFVELAARADVVITAHLAQKGDGDATG